MDLADPERALVVTYAPPHARAGLAALFALDERLGAIVAATSEPTIGLIRLAWWRESIETLDGAPPPAEPLLEALADVVAQGVPAATIAEIEDGWAALLDGPMDAEAIARHGNARAYLFVAAGQLLGTPPPLYRHPGLDPGSSFPNSEAGRWIPDQVRDDESILAEALKGAGMGWALADLGHRHSDPDVRAEARRQSRVNLAPLRDKRWPRVALPLAALTILAMRDAEGEGDRRQGAPIRLLRLLALRVFGR